MFVYLDKERSTGMNRRRLILSAAGAGLAVSGLVAPAGLAASAATDDELAYANFGLAAEFLLQDFFAKSAAAKFFAGAAAREVARGGFNAGEHAAALSKLLTDAGQTAAVEDDFEFAWPDGTFATRKSAAAAGLTVTQTLLGVYLGAAAAISIASYRTLFASMAANLAQQIAALSQLSGGRVVGISFPPALDVETASDAIEAYLG
jgi:Ferritin-like domain